MGGREDHGGVAYTVSSPSVESSTTIVKYLSNPAGVIGGHVTRRHKHWSASVLDRPVAAGAYGGVGGGADGGGGMAVAFERHRKHFRGSCLEMAYHVHESCPSPDSIIARASPTLMKWISIATNPCLLESKNLGNEAHARQGRGGEGHVRGEEASPAC